MSQFSSPFDQNSRRDDSPERSSIISDRAVKAMSEDPGWDAIANGQLATPGDFAAEQADQLAKEISRKTAGED